jgi:hypothetical protein
MTAVELYQIAGEFYAMHEKVMALPSFQSCAVKPPEAIAGGTAVDD